MKIVDKEQERIDYENSPEGKKKQWIGLAIGIVFFLVSGILYRVLPSFEIGGGKPYVIVMDGLEITPGKTTVQELADAGYELTDESAKVMASERDEDGNFVFYYKDVYDLSAETEPRTMYDSLVLLKGDEQAAEISIINDRGINLAVSQCIITDVTIRNDYVDADKVTVAGTPFAQLTEDKITEAFGKKDRSLDNIYTWNKGNYYFYLTILEDGTVRSVSTNKYYRTQAAE